jgi:hypothetical protein
VDSDFRPSVLWMVAARLFDITLKSSLIPYVAKKRTAPLGKPASPLLDPRDAMLDAW